MSTKIEKNIHTSPCGGFRESNSGPLAPEASIMPLNQIPAVQREKINGIGSSMRRVIALCLWRIDCRPAHSKFGRPKQGSASPYKVRPARQGSAGPGGVGW